MFLLKDMHNFVSIVMVTPMHDAVYIIIIGLLLHAFAFNF